MFLFLSIIQAIVAAALVGVVLMQRSEGGGLGLGGGGSPGGLMSARGAADFLTRTTKWLAVLFVTLAIVLAAVAVNTTSSSGEIDDSLERRTAPAGGAAPGAPDPLAPVADPLAPVGGQAPAAAPPAPADDPLSGAQ
ncbi:MAG: preprotein translocase subunit SecG [Sphingomonadales bacterium 32-68-7]|nr:MAG: preprotein translocase subunit SecG [Sphingomonadales bacterium 12-68-11]OYX09909.1 MAG: preprotein translocase subunit SecG [Sphingomonadales bacterium 32-68-7]